VSAVVYILCALTALACAVLLLRGYAKTRSTLLLWSGLCFVGLTVNNTLVFVDLHVVPHTSLLIYRNVATFVSACLLLYGLVWDSK
jgi:hypothetical protein